MIRTVELPAGCARSFTRVLRGVAEVWARLKVKYLKADWARARFKSDISRAGQCASAFGCPHENTQAADQCHSMTCLQAMLVCKSLDDPLLQSQARCKPLS